MPNTPSWVTCLSSIQIEEDLLGLMLVLYLELTLHINLDKPNKW